MTADWDNWNPYNFVEWDSTEPKTIDGSRHVTHERWHGELSGVLDLDLVARSPIFVPEGDPGRKKEDERDADPTPRNFWSCVRGDGEVHYGLPGSSVKGAVRNCFEAWTDARLGVVSDSWYEKPIPYRRRTAQVWVVEANGNGDLPVRACEVRFAKENGDGSWCYGMPANRRLEEHPWKREPYPVPTENDRVSFDEASEGEWQAVSFRANLFWVPKKAHRHRWTHLAVRLSKRKATIPACVVKKYRDNLDHLAFVEHPKRVNKIPKASGGPKNMYKKIDSESLKKRRADLQRLGAGDVIFAMDDGKDPCRIVCFGKNVNFLWPSETSPEKLVEKYMPLANLDLARADWAEATFGYAARHTADESSHPFRGRVRFETFWGPAVPQDAEQRSTVQLKALLSPAGIKLKARPLYLKPIDGKCASYDDPGAALRGRKFYWHQTPATGGEILGEHEPQAGDASIEIEALPADTRFAGRIHFDNLSAVELGALLVAVRPDLYFDDGAQYGWKLGKGKPRGLGSVQVVGSRLQLRNRVEDAYGALDASPLADAREVDVNDIAAFKRQIEAKTARVRDLQALLRFPPLPQPRNYYPPSITHPSIPNKSVGLYCGWMPVFDNRQGESSTSRPPAMSPARDVAKRDSTRRRQK